MNTPNTAKSRILVVEDEAIVAADISERLRRMGYDVLGFANTGERAIELATELKPELVLMDITLKGKMSGTEAAGYITSQLHLPIIFLTANSDDAVFRRARDTAPFGFILKPFDEFALKANIEIALYKHRIERDRENLIEELQTALVEIKTLKSLLPICNDCKKVRDDNAYLQRLKNYLTQHFESADTNGYCPDCLKKFVGNANYEINGDLVRKRKSGGSEL